MGLAAEPGTDADAVDENTLLAWVVGPELSVPEFVPDSEVASKSNSRSLPELHECPKLSGGGESDVFMFHVPVISALSRFIVRKFEAGAEKGEVGLRPGDRGGSGGPSAELVGDSGEYGGGASGCGT